MTEDGILPKGALDGEEGDITSQRIMQALRERFLGYIPGLTREESSLGGYIDRRIVRDIQKFDDMVGLRDVSNALNAAAEETMAGIRSRPAWKSSGWADVTPAQPEGRPDIYQALEKVAEVMFAEGIMWSQCCGDNKAPLLHYVMQVGMSLRTIKCIPGFDAGDAVDEYDRKLVQQIHEFNEMPGLKDIKRIMDDTANGLFEKLGLKSPEKMTVPKPLQFKPKAG